VNWYKQRHRIAGIKSELPVLRAGERWRLQLVMRAPRGRVNFHGVDAEIIEYNVHEDNKLVRKALGEINFPEGAIIAGVIRGSKGVIPDASLQLQIDDKVIVFMLPVAIKKVESLFK